MLIPHSMRQISIYVFQQIDVVCLANLEIGDQSILAQLLRTAKTIVLRDIVQVYTCRSETSMRHCSIIECFPTRRNSTHDLNWGQ